MPSRRRLVVAVHDVAPSSLEETRFLLAALDRIGARPRVLKVIPQHLPEYPELLQLLRDEQAKASEVVLHGFTHRTSGRLRGPWPRRLRAAMFAPRDAEFLSLSATEMAERLDEGRELLRRASLLVTGFCAPAWLESPELHPMLRRAGFRYDVRMASLVDLATNRRILTDWIGYMGAGGLQERLVGIANAINRGAAPMFRVLKVFLHPQGARDSIACRRILDLIPVLMRSRTLTTYGQLVTD